MVVVVVVVVMVVGVVVVDVLWLSGVLNFIVGAVLKVAWSSGYDSGLFVCFIA